MKCQTIALHEHATLTTYVLDDSPEMLKGKRRPAVIICPGGSYLSCSDREGEPVAMHFAAMGYHAFVLRYGVYGGGWAAVGKPMEDKPHCRHPEPMRDIARAMLKLRTHADEWLVDVDRIIVCGFSAGGHNVGMYITNWHKPVITEFFGRPAGDFRPAAAILGYSRSDFIYLKANAPADPMGVKLFAASHTAYLGSPEPEDSLLEEASPARNVSEHTPPTFLWATAEDSLVPVQHNLLMAKALADKGIPFELHVFESGPHGLSVATQASAAALSYIRPEAAKWVPLCDAWLQKRFALELPPLTPWEMMK